VSLARVDTRPRRQNSRRADEERRFPVHLQWLRGRPCAVAQSGGCAGKIEAAHVDHAGGKGIALKVSDRHAIPLCHEHHREQHQHGWMTFEAKHRLDATAAAAAYARVSPHRAKWELPR
jgi:hypothetical protein